MAQRLDGLLQLRLHAGPDGVRPLLHGRRLGQRLHGEPVEHGHGQRHRADRLLRERRGVEGNKDGLYFFGTNGRQANSWGNGTSYQCVLAARQARWHPRRRRTNGACDGTFSQDLNARWTAKPNQNPGAGSFVQVQLWYRDPASTSNQTTSFSDAIEFCVAP